jgi:hypothetical protein
VACLCMAWYYDGWKSLRRAYFFPFFKKVSHKMEN